MKNASLCSVIGSGILLACNLLSWLASLGRWGSGSLESIYNIIRLCYIIGCGLVFYFFFKLYKKQ